MDIPAYIGGPLIIVGSIALGVALSILLKRWIGTKEPRPVQMYPWPPEDYMAGLWGSAYIQTDAYKQDQLAKNQGMRDAFDKLNR